MISRTALIVILAGASVSSKCVWSASAFSPERRLRSNLYALSNARLVLAKNPVIDERSSSTTLHALPPYNWLFHKKDKDDDGDERTKDFTGKSAKSQQRTARLMEDHRRAQEASERTSAMMEELSSTLVVGKSKAGASGGIGMGDRRGGVKVTFNGHQRPVGVEVDPKFLFSPSGPESQGVVSVEELNEAITDAMLDGYQKSGQLMEEKMKGLYEHLGLPRDPVPLPSEEDDKSK